MKYIDWILAHLGYWSVMLLSAAGIGRGLLRRHIFAATLERIVFTIGLGLGSMATIIFLLGLAGWMHRWLLIGLTIPFALFELVCLAREIRLSPVRDLLARQRARPWRTAALALALFAGAGYWVSLLAATQYPPVAWDSVDEHLIVARQFLALHRPVPLLGIIEPVLPNLDHMLFAWGMALRDDIMAQMISHTFLMLTALGLCAWGHRQKSLWLGVALAAFWLGNPMVLWLGECAYVDLCMICFAFLAIYALRVFWLNRDYRWWYLAMALCGMAAGAKLPGLFFTASGILTGLVALIQSRLRGKLRRSANPDKDRYEPLRLAPIALGWVIALLMIAPWYGFIFYHTGNPFWPAFARYSRGIWASPALIQMMRAFLTQAAEPRTVRSFVMLPLNWFRRPELYSIAMHPPLNPLIVAWPLAWVVAVWNRQVRWWALFAFLFTLYWFFTLQDLRFWLPALPLSAIALFESLRWLLERPTMPRWRPAVFALLAVFSLAIGARYFMPIMRYRSLPPVTAEEREAYLMRVSGYPAAAYVNSQAKTGEVVAVVFGPWLGYYLKPETLDLYGFLQLNRFPRYHWPEDEQWVRWLESHNARWILLVHKDARPYLKIPNEDPAVKPFWPDYELVYSHAGTWVFLHKPVSQDVRRIIDSDNGDTPSGAFESGKAHSK